MKIIITGSGKVGFTLAEQLVRESHDVTIVDLKEAALRRAADMLDIMVVQGNGVSANVLREAGNSMLYYGRIIFTSLADLLRGRENINNLSGPVGIVTAIGQAASYGWQDLLQLLVLITVNLGIFNLLPFPALDGGKVVFLLIEGVTGHAVPEKIQSGLTLAAFALLFGLMLFATYNDIVRLITGAV